MIASMKTDYRLWIIVAIAAVAVLGIWWVKPIAQDLCYHQFADQKTLFGIANFWNVISNLPFIFVAIYGMFGLINNSAVKPGSLRFFQCWVFLVGVFFTGLGSAHYHYNPNNATLVWDRLPLTLAFMSLFSLVISEYISVRAAKYLFLPLLLVGAFSIVYWNYTENLGRGDLRLYALVQFLPIVIIPIVLALYYKNSNLTVYLWWTFGFYLLAKLLELFDAQVFIWLGVMSGHPLKHLSAAIAVYCLAKGMLRIHSSK